MAILRIPAENRSITDPETIARYLKDTGIGYEQWTPDNPVARDAPPGAVLQAYGKEVEKLKATGGYVTADVIDVNPKTPGLGAMLAKFDHEHWHDEDEVRFVIHGRGLFHIRPGHGPVLAIEVEPGDLLRVPKGTLHWFHLCGEREIRCIRLFQDPSGWTPHYTQSGADQGYEPVCLGPQYFSAPFGKR